MPANGQEAEGMIRGLAGAENTDFVVTPGSMEWNDSEKVFRIWNDAIPQIESGELLKYCYMQ